MIREELPKTGEWISVKDKLPEDIFEIGDNDEFEAVVTYFPLKLCEINGEKMFLIDDTATKEKAIVERKKRWSREEYFWKKEGFVSIYDEQVVEWMPLPKT